MGSLTWTDISSCCSREETEQQSPRQHCTYSKLVPIHLHMPLVVGCTSSVTVSALTPWTVCSPKLHSYLSILFYGCFLADKVSRLGGSGVTEWETHDTL